MCWITGNDNLRLHNHINFFSAVDAAEGTLGDDLVLAVAASLSSTLRNWGSCASGWLSIGKRTHSLISSSDKLLEPNHMRIISDKSTLLRVSIP